MIHIDTHEKLRRKNTCSRECLKAGRTSLSSDIFWQPTVQCVCNIQAGVGDRCPMPKICKDVGTMELSVQVLQDLDSAVEGVGNILEGSFCPHRVSCAQEVFGGLFWSVLALQLCDCAFSDPGAHACAFPDTISMHGASFFNPSISRPMEGREKCASTCDLSGAMISPPLPLSRPEQQTIGD